MDNLVFRPLDTTGDCTRFIQIEPAESDEDQIVCRHVHISFRDRPKYEALSYKWGDVKDKETIILNGFELAIGKNLRAALRFLRRLNGQASYKLFWIDALCINQDELDERTRQVQWMGQIYFRARRVIVW
ncbi:HET-domain-containing protein, partial [Cryphonectria parasitica EP155]